MSAFEKIQALRELTRTTHVLTYRAQRTLLQSLSDADLAEVSQLTQAADALSGGRCVMTFLTRASAILDRGFSTIPLQENEKTPLTANGAKNRTRDRNVVTAWSEQHPNANAAIIADENHVILESDDAERLQQYLTQLGVAMPSTFTQQARANRPHWIFKRPAFRVDNLTLPGVFEFKADNLYVVGFGSVHPSGAEYVITDKREPAFLPLGLWDALQQMREARMGYENPASRFVAPGPVALLKAEVKRFPYCGEWDVLLDDNAAQKTADFRIEESERHYSLISLAGTFRNAFPEAVAEDLCQKLGKVRDHFCDDGGRAITDGELMNIATWVEKREAVSSPLVVMGAPLPLSAPTPTPLTVTVTLPSTPSDLIEELAEELTAGTLLPRQFARETLKMLLLSCLPTLKLPWYPQLHNRQYVVLLSNVPGAGKGESWRRAWATLEKAELIKDRALELIDGRVLGSPEFAVKEFGGRKVVDGGDGGAPSIDVRIGPRGRIVHYDEGSHMMQKDANAGSNGLMRMFTSLFDANRHGTGSLKNGKYVCDTAQVSGMWHFVQESFERSFTGTGATMDGFLSRCSLVRGEKQRIRGDWREVDRQRVRLLMDAIEDRVEAVEATGLVGEFTEEDKTTRIAFTNEMQEWEAKIAARLVFHFYQDLAVRRVFATTSSAEVLKAAIAWTREQYATRLLAYPLDVSRDRDESMSLTLRHAFQKHGKLTRRQIRQYANVGRIGSGGDVVLARVLRSMEVKPVSGEKTRTGNPYFYLPDEAED